MPGNAHWFIILVAALFYSMVQGAPVNPEGQSTLGWRGWKAFSTPAAASGQNVTDPDLAPFPDPLRLWKGGAFRFLGSGIKYKTIVFIHVQIYEVALYVEEKEAQAEFQRLEKEGFFKRKDSDTICRALVTGRFKKLLQIRLLRSVSPSQLTGEIGKDLQPRLQQGGNEDQWDQFVAYVNTQRTDNGASFLALIEGDGSADGGLYPPETKDFQHVKRDLAYSSAAFGEALLDMYLGSAPLVPDAKAKWAASAKELFLGRPDGS